MTQQRFDNFGDSIIAYSTNQARSKLFGPVVLSGGIFSVSSNTLSISAVSVLLPSGVVVSDDQSQIISLDSVPGSSSTTYTIVYTHSDQSIIHGTAAVIEVFNGLIEQSAVANGTILGWVKYPGGNVSLSINHIVSSRTYRVENDVSKNDIANLGCILPPMSDKFLAYSSSGAVITISDICDVSNPSLIKAYTQFYNSSSTISGNVIKVLPFICGKYPPGLISLELYADLDAEVSVTIIDSTGVEISPTNNVITNTTIFMNRNIIIDPDYSLFAERSVFLVKLNILLDPLKRIRFKHIGYSTYNLPF